MRKASRSMTITAVILSAASAILWGVAVAQIWEAVPERVMPTDRAGAVTTAVIAAMCWQRAAARRRDDRERRHERREDIHLDTIEMLTRPPAPARRAATGPLRPVR